MPNREVVLCAPVRTAIGTYGGSLKSIPAAGLGAVAIRESLARAGLAPEAVETVVLGQVIQAGAKMNPARQAAISAGLPIGVPAMTVNRVCGSGAQAIASAAAEIMADAARRAIAGGMENMDQAPYLISNGRWGYRMGDATIHDSMLYDGLNDAFSSQHSGWHTEDLAAKSGIGREAQDRWALRSQSRFAAAQAAGKFKDEIVPVEVPGRKGPEVFATDEHNRPDTTLESLSKLKLAFRKDGTITAGNAPGLNSGAAAMIVAERGFAEEKGIALAIEMLA
jgi:acetyl-CoA C-acetyltransferase